MGRYSAYKLFAFLFCVVGSYVHAQERCGTVPYTERLRQKNALPPSDEVFESWLSKKINAARMLRQQQGPPYQIPVVVHVIHNGEPVGTGRNISDAQVLSQIEVLNADFNRLNADAANTPNDFLSVAGSMDIEFVLARQDPEGLASDGIVRVKGSKAQWSMDDNYELKAQSYWPAEKYFNIWVADLSQYLGWAQLPVSNLPGLENSSSNRLTDGIVIWYRAFGSDAHGDFDLAADFSKGRTATHETGHFLGLRHIWGDDGGGCFGTDNVEDTPNQAGETNGCPIHPNGDACGDDRMFQNYMDYSNDGCMNLFTLGQVERMDVVLENSPRRSSLLTSPGLLEPVPVPDDLGLRLIASPGRSTCDPLINPLVEVRNYGSNKVTTATIQLSINGNVQETTSFNVDLDPFETAQLSFDAVNLAPGFFELLFEIVTTNGVVDGNTNNNALSGSVAIPAVLPVPFSEDFSSLPPAWSIENPDQNITWEIAVAPRGETTNLALKLDNYNYTDAFGERDIFLSPVFDLTDAPVASLIFHVANARYGASFDRLQVIVLTDCQPIAEGTIVYDKQGAPLTTVSPTSSSFVPSGPADWRREQISLDDFLGEPHVQLAFLAISDWGNNLYIDDLSVLVSEFDDLAIEDVALPAPVTCDPSPSPRLLIQNLGIGDVDFFEVFFRVNDGPGQTVTFENAQFIEASSMTFDLPQVDLEDGLNTLTFAVGNPNGLQDDNTANDTLVYQVLVNADRDRVPLRVDFANQPGNGWSTINPRGGMPWKTVPLSSGTAAVFHAYEDETPGDQAWLVSPVLDFSLALQASLVFDVSYRERRGNRERLDVMVSTDCGNTFEVLTSYPLPGFSRHDSWVPEQPLDWITNAVVNLDVLAGEQNARVAFRVTNDNGNNLYLDSLEFFTASTPNLLDIETPYSIYGYDSADPSANELKLIFNLHEQADVAFSISDMMGRTFASGVVREVLNQTFPLPTEGLAAGVYVVRLKIGKQYYTERILVSH